MTFKDAFKIILKYEGGHVNDPNDPGGETKFGISKKAYPNCDIANLTEERAAKIYWMDYWDKMNCDKLSPTIRLLVFDCAVNQGVVKATKLMQLVAGVIDDGILGPVTMRAMEDVRDSDFINDYSKLRHHHYSSLKTWEHYGKGWSRRLMEVSLICAFRVGHDVIRP